jgi:hypothetical protein
LGHDNEHVEEFVTALVLELFIDHFSPASARAEQFKKGVNDAWFGNKMDEARELLQGYSKYKENFTKELGL